MYAFFFNLRIIEKNKIAKIYKNKLLILNLFFFFSSTFTLYVFSLIFSFKFLSNQR